MVKLITMYNLVYTNKILKNKSYLPKKKKSIVWLSKDILFLFSSLEILLYK
jgi:hypothetical protein